MKTDFSRMFGLILVAVSVLAIIVEGYSFPELEWLLFAIAAFTGVVSMIRGGSVQIIGWVLVVIFFILPNMAKLERLISSLF